MSLNDASTHLSFITGTHPDQFRNKTTQKTIKSHIRTKYHAKRREAELVVSPDQHTELGVSATEEASSSAEVERDSVYAVRSVDIEPVPSPALGHRSSLLFQFENQYVRHDTSGLVRELRFSSLPQFHDTRINVEHMLHDFLQDFGPFVSDRYLNSMVEMTFPLLSYACIAATWRSIKAGTYNRSVELMSARNEVYHQINHVLQQDTDDMAPKVCDAMIYALKHQLFIDLLMGNAQTIAAHIHGLDMMVRLRGGLDKLDLEAPTSQGLTLHVLLGCIVADTRVPATFKPPCKHAIPDQEAYAQRVGAFPIDYLPLSPWCLPELFGLLSEVRSLTEEFLDSARPNPSPESHSYQRLLQSYSERLEELDNTPSFKGEEKPMWIYEACRLATIIYATAIVHCLPLSLAASKASVEFHIPNMLDDFCHAINNTDFYGSPHLWAEMSSCFFWVAMIAGSAGYCDLYDDTEHGDEKAARRRTKLTLATTSSTWIMVSTHHHAMWKAMQNILEVQEKLASYSTVIVEARMSASTRF